MIKSTSATYPSLVNAGALQPPLLTVHDRTGRMKSVDLSWLAELGSRALVELVATEGLAGSSVRVVVVGDEEMASAHERFSGVAGTTDVLTFDLRDEPRGPLDTDIMVCLNEAERCGQERGHAALRELLLYVVHGILHCLGHDDHDEAAYARMHAREDQVLEAIGVGRTFAAESGRRG